MDPYHLPDLTELTYFDPDQYLREKPKDRILLQQAIARAETFLQEIKATHEEVDPVYLLYLYGYLGNGYRVLDQAETAIRFLDEALQLVRLIGDVGAEVRTLIRLGEAYKYHHQHEQALQLFSSVQTLCQRPELNQYLDFVYQHQGKCLMEMKRYDESFTLFEKALAIRQKKGVHSLIQSTEKAIRLVSQLRAQSET